MTEIKTHRQLWGTDFPLNGEWDAKTTRPNVRPELAGRWTVRRDPEQFVVIFHHFQNGQETGWPNTQTQSKANWMPSCLH